MPRHYCSFASSAPPITQHEAFGLTGTCAHPHSTRTGSASFPEGEKLPVGITSIRAVALEGVGGGEAEAGERAQRETQ